ncbi:GbsR/MarR family transcriptional regulator [Pseudonocardia lacus]|uniref:GbsR/MarR family transcriptional regulator n=1 Tax=Pseudonocardia lacus TaxID=2835865 RepID=UPI001BDDB770|nr:transcriptional regulator [Pseudonocardia lacus]
MVLDPPPDEALRWVERIAKYCADQDGVPLIAGRILGWLTIAVPAEQSATQIAAAIGASRASLTTNLRLLDSVGFVTQLTHPGERTVYYRVDDGAWARVVRRQVASLAALGEILQDGTDLVRGSPEGAARMRVANEVFAWLADVFAHAPPMPGETRTAGRAAPEEPS